MTGLPHTHALSFFFTYFHSKRKTSIFATSSPCLRDSRGYSPQTIHTMKKLITLAIAACLGISSMAQSEFRDRHMAYKGFANIGLGSAFYDDESSTSFSFTTSHGVQINPTFFVGAGIGVELSSNSYSGGATAIAPIFGQARINFLNKPISPYLDFKGGGSVGDFKGGYVEPSIGVSMPVANRFAINFSFVYILYTHKESYWIHSYLELHKRESLHNIGFKFGFEF